MKLIYISLFYAIIALTYAGKGIEYNNTDPEYPGKCVTRGLVLSPGESGQNFPICHKITCNNEYGETTIEGCNVKLVLPPCNVFYIYHGEAFPKCCETEYRCPEGFEPVRVF